MKSIAYSDSTDLKVEKITRPIKGENMSTYTAEVLWSRDSEAPYIDNQYSRAHQWRFDGGASVDASSSPQVVPLPYSVPEHVDPEEAFVASLSSCHMLFFLSIAAKNKFVIDHYIDQAIGFMEKDSNQKVAMTKVILRPKVSFSGDKQPTLKKLEKMHAQAHSQCFIANSVKTEVVIEVVV